ncbi:MAG: uroporphyrinogen-III decarboxylase-like protein [Firmicutes bacterium]|nr:uroporphyrinogen-III decarboxylase-like protein [Bacillota bacterium]
MEIMEAVTGEKFPDRASTVKFYYKAGYDYVPAWPRLDMVKGSLIDTRSEYPIKDWRSFESYSWPAITSIDYSEFETVIPILPDGMKIIGQIGGIFETAQKLVGYQQLCYLIFDDPILVEAIFDRLGALYEAMYKGMADIEQVGAVVISDDMGFNTQTLISPESLRRFVLPWHKRLAQIAHDAGKPCILHSCGNLAAIMDDIIENVGIDAKHSYQDTILPVTEAKRQYGNRIAILGGFDVDRLCRSNELEIRHYTRVLMNEMGNEGGYAFGSGNSIAHFVPPGNYLAMLDEAWRIR